MNLLKRAAVITMLACTTTVGWAEELGKKDAMALLRSFDKAMNARDEAAVSAMVDEEAKFIINFPGQSKGAVIGKDALLDALLRAKDANAKQVKYRTVTEVFKSGGNEWTITSLASDVGEVAGQKLIVQTGETVRIGMRRGQAVLLGGVTTVEEPR